MGEGGLLTIHTDGASRGNPGEAAFAYVIQADATPPIEEAGCLGRMTNNQAEYTALVRALGRALRLGPEHSLLILSDSELMVRQMNGQYRVKNEELLDLYEQARALVRRFRGGVTIRHVRREENARADSLCNQALDSQCAPAKQKATAKARPAKGHAASLREQALECLHEARQAWFAHEEAPTPEQVWQQIQDLLRRHGALKSG
jgi:ribonuclease HI